jgi:hypothetical protein
MVGAVWACALAMRVGRWYRWTTLVGVMILAALTHVGTFGVTVLIIGLTLALWLGARLNRDHAIVWWRTAGTIAATGVALMFHVDRVEPARARDLISAPVAIFLNAGWGGHRGVATVMLIVTIAVAAVALQQAWLEHRKGIPTEAAILAASSIAGIVLTLPTNIEYLGRFLLMAGSPVAIVFTFIVARQAGTGRPLWPGFVALVVALGVAAISVQRARPLSPYASVVGVESGKELRRLRDQIPDSGSSLVLAKHGLEWWASYFLHTPVRTATIERQPDGTPVLGPIPVNAFTRYTRVLYLRPSSESSSVGSVPVPSVTGASLVTVYAGPTFELYELRRSSPKLTNSR